MRAGDMRYQVTLANPPTVTNDEDGVWQPLTPPQVWAAIEPLAPGSGDNRQLSHLVRMRVHPQVTIDTRITVAGGRRLYVRGLQDAGGDELRLLCEEILQ